MKKNVAAHIVRLSIRRTIELAAQEYKIPSKCWWPKNGRWSSLVQDGLRLYHSGFSWEDIRLYMLFRLRDMYGF